MFAREVVYLDVILAVNWLLDYFILWASARFGQLASDWKRLTLAATMGALYALLPFSSVNRVVLDAGGKFAFSLLMILVAYRGLTWRSFLNAVFYFYLVTFTMAGAMLGAIYFFTSRPDTYGLLDGLVGVLSRIPYPWLMAAVGTALLLARWGAPLLRQSFLKSLFHVPVVIRFGENRLAVRALVDTGNQLRDPLTQKPVIIVEYGVLQPLLPSAVRKSLDTAEEADLSSMAGDLQGTPWAARLHLVPFTSIGRARGMLLCFRPDEVVVVTNDRMVRVKDVLVGIHRQKLSLHGGYRALLHPDILQATIA